MSEDEIVSKSCNGYLMIIETREDEETLLDKLKDDNIDKIKLKVKRINETLE